MAVLTIPLIVCASRKWLFHMTSYAFIWINKKWHKSHCWWLTYMKEMSPKTKTHVSNGTLQMDFLLKLFLDHIHILVLTMLIHMQRTSIYSFNICIWLAQVNAQRTQILIYAGSLLSGGTAASWLTFLAGQGVSTSFEVCAQQVHVRCFLSFFFARKFICSVD